MGTVAEICRSVSIFSNTCSSLMMNLFTFRSPGQTSCNVADELHGFARTVWTLMSWRYLGIGRVSDWIRLHFPTNIYAVFYLLFWVLLFYFHFQISFEQMVLQNGPAEAPELFSTEQIVRSTIIIFCNELSYIFQLYIGDVYLEDEKYVRG